MSNPVFDFFDWLAALFGGTPPSTPPSAPSPPDPDASVAGTAKAILGIGRRPAGRTVPSAGRTTASLPSRAATAGGSLRVRILEPRVEIRYNEKHYSGTNLARFYDDGEDMTRYRANRILEWEAYDGPPTKYTPKGENYQDYVGRSGVFYYKYLGDNEKQARIKAWGRHVQKMLKPSWVETIELPPKIVDLGGGRSYEIPQRITHVHDAIYAPDPPGQGPRNGAAHHNARNHLENAKYTKVDAKYGETFVLDLKPGWYQIIADPRWRGGVVRRWKYLSGYWQWTRNGPQAKSAETQYNRFVSGDHCTHDLTVFKRILEQDQWGDLNTVVMVAAGSRPSRAEFAPVVELEVTNRTTDVTGFSRSFKAACKSYKYSKIAITKVYGGLGAFIIEVVERFFQETVKRA